MFCNLIISGLFEIVDIYMGQGANLASWTFFSIEIIVSVKEYNIYHGLSLRFEVQIQHINFWGLDVPFWNIKSLLKILFGRLKHRCRKNV